MKRWEYNTIVVDGNIPEAVPYLDADGAQGWEIVYVQPSPYGITYLMKRELVDQTAPATQALGGPIIKHNHSIERACRRECEWYGTSNQIQW